MHDPYIENVKIKETRRGKILLTKADYVRGEILQYDMPYIDDDIVVPRDSDFSQNPFVLPHFTKEQYRGSAYVLPKLIQ